MKKKEKIVVKMSIVINIIIAILVLVASIMMYTRFRFMNGYAPILESNKIEMIRFFTVDSNILMGIVALLFGIEEIKYLQGKISTITTKMYMLKFMSTSAVSLTFFIVFVYLGQIAEYGLFSLLQNSNLFFHLIIPLMSIANFTILERTSKIKLSQTWKGIIPTIVYACFYLTNILIHMKDGKISPVYDWYRFVQNGVWTALLVVPIILGISYLISLILWRLNKKKETEK